MPFPGLRMSAHMTPPSADEATSAEEVSMTPEQRTDHRRLQQDQAAQDARAQIDADYEKKYGDRNPSRLA